MMQKLKPDSKGREIFLSLLIGLLMNPIWIVIIFIIDTSHTSSNDLFSTPLLERTPVAYMYYWLEMFITGKPYNFNAPMSSVLISNTLFYFFLSFGLLSFFGSAKFNGEKILSVLIAVMMNPVLLFTIFIIDPGTLSRGLFPISIFHQAPFGYMFCWSIVVLPTNPLDLRAATLLPLIINPILYFALSYGLLSLLKRNKNELM